MKMNANEKITLIVCLSLMAGLSSLAAGMFVTVVPPSLTYENVLKGSSYQKEFRIINTENFSIYYNIYVREDIADWFSFDTPSPVEVPANSGIKVAAIVNPPEDTANGIYSCTIVIKPVTDITAEGEGLVAGLISAGAVSTSIEVVGDQIRSGKVSDVSTRDVEVGEPVVFKMKFSNDGNVKVKPKINISILKDRHVVDSLVEETDFVIPGERKDIEIKEDTTDKKTGRYTAKIGVSLDDEIISNNELEFNVFEKGWFKREGRIITDAVKAPSEIGMDEIAKIEIPFKNTGDLDIEAQISAEVFLDGKLIDTLKGNTVLVEVDKTENLILYVKPKGVGSYTVRGRVSYEGKTATLYNPIEFTVKEKTTAVSTTNVASEGETSSLPITAIVIVGLAAMIGILVYSTMKKNEGNGLGFT